MKVLKKILLGLVALVVLLLVVAVFMPATYHAERSIVIDRPAAQIHAVMADLGQFKKWSPWEHLDPNMTQKLSTPSNNVGASLYWTGNDDAGEGSMVITSIAPDRIEMDLHFIRPMEDKAKLNYTLVPEGNGTRVTWGMDGDSPYPIGRLMGPFINSMVGPDFEAGLKNLKGLVEGQPTMPVESSQSSDSTGSK